MSADSLITQVYRTLAHVLYENTCNGKQDVVCKAMKFIEVWHMAKLEGETEK